MLMIKIELATRNTPICQLCYGALTLRSDAHCYMSSMTWQWHAFQKGHMRTVLANARRRLLLGQGPTREQGGEA